MILLIVIIFIRILFFKFIYYNNLYKSLIQGGTSITNLELASNKVVSANSWVIPFVYLQLNSTLDLVKKRVLISCLQWRMMLPKSLLLLLLQLKTSTTIFDSSEKSVLSKPNSATHYSAWQSPDASLTSIEYKGANQVVFASTKHLSASWMHV